MRTAIITTLLFIGLTSFSRAATDIDILKAEALNPLAPAQTQQWGQLVGSWDISYALPDGSIGKAEWHFFYILDGFAIGDIWINPPRGAALPANRSHNLQGINIRAFNQTTEQWNMAWIENQTGALQTYTGFEQDGALVMLQNGEEDIVKITFYNISDDHFDWKQERSSDDGATFVTEFAFSGERVN